MFNDSIANMNKLPTHVSYKIRMNTDKVYTGLIILVCEYNVIDDEVYGGSTF